MIWKGVLGQHGIGKMNSNGLRLLSMCAENNLTVTNTLFRQADKYKITWMHPRAKQWHMIDYAICRMRDIRDVKITKAMRGAECSPGSPFGQDHPVTPHCTHTPQ